MFWEGAQIDFSVIGGATSLTAVISEAVLENVPNPTIVRIRGVLNLSSTAVAGADHGYERLLFPKQYWRMYRIQQSFVSVVCSICLRLQ